MIVKHYRYNGQWARTVHDFIDQMFDKTETKKNRFKIVRYSLNEPGDCLNVAALNAFSTVSHNSHVQLTFVACVLHKKGNMHKLWSMANMVWFLSKKNKYQIELKHKPSFTCQCLNVFYILLMFFTFFCFFFLLFFHRQNKCERRWFSVVCRTCVYLMDFMVIDCKSG